MEKAPLQLKSWLPDKLYFVLSSNVKKISSLGSTHLIFSTAVRENIRVVRSLLNIVSSWSAVSPLFIRLMKSFPLYNLLPVASCSTIMYLLQFCAKDIRTNNIKRPNSVTIVFIAQRFCTASSEAINDEEV